MSTCDLCGEPTRGVTRCEPCTSYALYWESMSPDEQRAEIESMDRHVAESEHL